MRAMQQSSVSVLLFTHTHTHTHTKSSLSKRYCTGWEDIQAPGCPGTHSLFSQTNKPRYLNFTEPPIFCRATRKRWTRRPARPPWGASQLTRRPRTTRPADAWREAGGCYSQTPPPLAFIPVKLLRPVGSCAPAPTCRRRRRRRSVDARPRGRVAAARRARMLRCAFSARHQNFLRGAGKGLRRSNRPKNPPPCRLKNKIARRPPSRHGGDPAALSTRMSAAVAVCSYTLTPERRATAALTHRL